MQADDPLLACERVTITPHSAIYNYTCMKNMNRKVMEDIYCMERGEMCIRDSPNYECLKFADVLKAVAAVGKPVVLIVKQDMPEEIKCRNGLLGGNMMTALRSAGCVGVISDGPSRDVDEICLLYTSRCV